MRCCLQPIENKKCLLQVQQCQKSLYWLVSHCHVQTWFITVHGLRNRRFIENWVITEKMQSSLTQRQLNAWRWYLEVRLNTLKDAWCRTECGHAAVGDPTALLYWSQQPSELLSEEQIVRFQLGVWMKFHSLGRGIENKFDVLAQSMLKATSSFKEES